MFLTPPSFPVGQGPRAITSGDFDNDGDLDCAIANFDGFNVSILLGDGAGAFAPVVNLGVGDNNPQAITSGDFDSDGDLDLAVANLSGELRILLGNGAGGFATLHGPTVGSNPRAITGGDFDGDFDLDLAVAGGGVSILLGDGSGAFGAPVIFTAGNDPRAITTGDLDGDGDLDLAVANHGGGSPHEIDDVSILLGDGDGAFALPVNFAAGWHSSAITTGDLDDDGDLDLAVANRGHVEIHDLDSLSILLNDGSGGFSAPTDFAVSDDPLALTSGDLDGDGDLDLAVASERDGNVSILRGDGAGGFAQTVYVNPSLPSSAIAGGDFDSDGDFDIAIAGPPSSPGRVSLLLGDGAGGFPAAVSFAVGGRFGGSIEIADLDGDGNLDLAATGTDLPGWGGHVAALLGDGFGGFALASHIDVEGGDAITIGHLNGDENLDLAVANLGNQDVSILVGDGSGGFVVAEHIGVGGHPSSITSGDFDGNGSDDLAIATYNDEVAILLGVGSGGFGAVGHVAVGDAPRAIVNGDLDADGDLDLAVVNEESDNVSLLLNDGDGGFGASVDIPVGDAPHAIAIDDLDGDDDLDLAVANAGTNDVSILLGDGTGGFAVVQFASGDGSLVSGDFDGDGNLDLIVGTSILLGDGGGAFAPPVNVGVGGTTSADFDGDGDLDLAASGGGFVSLLFNQCLFGDPVAVPSDGAANRLDVGDLDGDGDSDVLAVLPDSNAAQVFLNEGTSAGAWLGLEPLAAVTVGPEPAAVALGFLDSDKHLDAVIANDGDDTLVLLFNDGSGNGTFEPPLLIPLDPGVVSDPRSVVAADFDGDGATDLAVANAGSNTVVILVNAQNSTFIFLESVPVALEPGVLDPCDVDGDKDLDLVVANSGGGANRVTFLANLGSASLGPGLFVPGPQFDVGASPVDLAGGDLNSDGLEDIVTANDDDGTMSILFNQGAGAFELGLNLPIGESAISVVAADFDLNGGTDLAAIATAPGIGLAIRIRLKTNAIPGNHSFDPPMSFVIDATPAFLATADFNDDGEVDLVTANTDAGGGGGGAMAQGESSGSGSVTVLLNNTAPSGLQAPCFADTDGNDDVGFGDLVALLISWGPCAPPPVECPSNLNGDGQVEHLDLELLLSNWGPC